MATNEVLDRADTVYVAVPSGKLSGEPCVSGQMPGVALIDRDAAGKVTMTRIGSHNLSVKGIDGGGNSAVAVGDIIYYTEADTPKLSKKATGVRFGYANGTVTSGGTSTIEVILGY